MSETQQKSYKKESRLGIIPAAGLASRLAGAPKFLLPDPRHGESLFGGEASGGGGTQTLLRRHAELHSTVCTNVIIVTRPEWHAVVESQVSDLMDCVVISTRSESMVESVMIAASIGGVRSSPGEYLLTLPDSHFNFVEAAEKLRLVTSSAELRLLCWENSKKTQGRFGEVGLSSDGVPKEHADKPNTSFLSHFWGALVFGNKFLQTLTPSMQSLANPIQHAILTSQAEALIVSGPYFDVGSLSGFKDLLVHYET